MRLFGSAFNNLFGAILISRPPKAPPPTMESMQRAQDVYSLANELRITPDVARTIIEGRELMRGIKA